MKDMIFKLKNGKDYYILEELSHNNQKYALAIECNLEKDEINDALDEYNESKYQGFDNLF